MKATSELTAYQTAELVTLHIGQVSIKTYENLDKNLQYMSKRMQGEITRDPVILRKIPVTAMEYPRNGSVHVR